MKQKIPSDFYVTPCMQYTAAMWRSFDYARNDDTKRRSSHISFHPAQQKAAPAGQIYPLPSARPFFKGLPNGHAKTLTLRKVSSPISSFRAQREIFLAQRSNRECEMRSSTYAIFSFPHMCSTPPGRKDPSTALGMTIRSDARLTFLFIPLSRRLPLRGRSILRLRRAPSSRGCSTGMQNESPVTSPKPKSPALRRSFFIGSVVPELR